MDKFVNKIKLENSTNQKLLNLIGKIDSYKGKWNAIESSETIYLGELRRIATIESIGSSTRIEGSKLSDDDVKELLQNVEITELEQRDEQEVIGYFDTLKIILENYDDIKLSVNYIKQLHKILLKYSEKDKRHRGRYKSVSNKVVAKYPGGKEKVIFNTTEMHLVDKEMKELINWVNKNLEKSEIHPLIITAIFIYEFLSIHPFQDGNGRLSRLLATLILLKNDYHFIQYVSFENLIEQTKKDYYKALMEGQKNRYKDSEDISKWLLYFLDSIYILTQRLDKKYQSYRSKGGYLNERQRKIKDYIETHQPVKISDINENFTDITIHTIKKDIQYMKRERLIKSAGRGKGTVYLSSDKN